MDRFRSNLLSKILLLVMIFQVLAPVKISAMGQGTNPEAVESEEPELEENQEISDSSEGSEETEPGSEGTQNLDELDGAGQEGSQVEEESGEETQPGDSQVDAEGETNIFSDPTIKMNGKELDVAEVNNVAIGDDVEVGYEWKIPDGQPINESYEISPIPVNIADFEELKGRLFPIKDGSGTEIGKFELLEGKIEVTFNDSMSGLNEREGWLKFNFKFSEADFLDDNMIELDFGKTYRIKSNKDLDGQNISKKGVLSESKEDIEWEIIVNENYESLDKITILDEIPEGLELYGQISVNEINKKGVVLSTVKEDKFPLIIEKLERPYSIKYKTKIKSVSTSFKNTAKIEGSEDEATATVEVEVINLSKKGSVEKKEDGIYIDWEILANDKGISYENLKLVDKFGESPKQTFVDGSLLVDGGKMEGAKFTTNDSGFSLELGKTDKAHTIRYSTKLDKSDIKLGETLEINNEVELSDGDKENTKYTVDAKVNYLEDKIITKHGEVRSKDDKEYIYWIVDVNKSKDKLPKGTVIKDIGNDNLILEKNSLVVKNSEGKELAESQYSVDYTEGLWKITLQEDTSENIRIEYNTEAIPNKKSYSNKADISLGGGKIDDSKTFNIHPGYFNDSIYKMIDKIDYNTGIVTWSVEIVSRSGDLKNITLTDSLENGKVDALNLRIGEEKIADKNIKINANAFELKLDENLIKKLKISNKLIIKYDTLIDFDSMSKDNLTFSNKAKANIETSIGGKNELDTWAYKDVPKWIQDNGKKEGSLDIENRKINWKLYLNPRGLDLGNVTISDIVDDGHVFVEESFKLKKYQFLENSEDIKETTELKDFSLKVDGKKASLTMNLNKPILIKYQTELKGLSKEKYENTAKLGDKEYISEVHFENYHKFISKVSKNDQSNIFPWDEIKWEIIINESYSEIENLEIEDIIGDGHSYLPGSIAITDISGDKTKEFDISIEDKKISISHKSLINKPYKISYSTIVEDTKENKEISNVAKISINGKAQSHQSESKLSVRAGASGGGSGIREKSLRIKKVDAVTKLPLEGAEFEILEQDGTVIFDKLTTDEYGQVVVDLPFGKYKLVETKAPEGYKRLTEPIEVYIYSDGGEASEIEIEVTNEKKPVTPTEPGEKEPETPTPTTPGENKPETPGEKEPETPTPTPTTPGENKPVVPEEEDKPERPGEKPKDPTDPGTPGEDRPETPGENKPTSPTEPGEKEPVRPGEKPKDPEEKDPVVPGENKPTTPTTPGENKPVVPEEEKEAERPGEKPKDPTDPVIPEEDPSIKDGEVAEKPEEDIVDGESAGKEKDKSDIKGDNKEGYESGNIGLDNSASGSDEENSEIKGDKEEASDKEGSQAKLPATGESSKYISLLAGLLILALGLSLWNKKEIEN